MRHEGRPFSVALAGRLRRCALVLALTSAGCAQPASPPAADDAASGVSTFLAATQAVDLTHPLGADSLFWPTGAPFAHTRDTWGRTPAGFWYASASFASPEHLGTHLDAPIHFAEGGWTSAQIPVDRFVSPGVVIDISARAGREPEAVLAPGEIAGWEERHGRVPRGAIVLIRTGWSARWPDWNTYYGSATPKDVATLRFPGVSELAAELLVERGVSGVGIDTASIDPGSSTTFEAHQVLAAANVYILENLTRLDVLPDQDFAVLALPMKIDGGTGGPARVVALVPRPAS